MSREEEKKIPNDVSFLVMFKRVDNIFFINIFVFFSYYFLQDEVRRMTRVYVSGGKLGDFIQQLSIVYERFLIDRQPAILYISERGDTFRFGLQKAYEDLLPIVSKQPYIKEFKIHQGEPFDVDLSSWRKHTTRNPLHDYVTWMKQEYDVEWGKHKWIWNIPTDPTWKDKIVINTTHYRFPETFPWKLQFRRTHPNQLWFVSFGAVDYQNFITKTGLKVRFHKPKSIYDFCVIINSCQLFIGSLSAPLSIAFSLHAPLKIGYFGQKQNHFDYQVFRTIGKFIPSVRK